MFKCKFYSRWTYHTCTADFKDVFLAVHVDNDLVTIFRVFEVGKGTGQTVGIRYMCSDNGVANPGWECCAIEPARIFAKPAHIPRVIVRFWHSVDGCFELEFGYLKPNIAIVFVGEVGRLGREEGNFIRSKASFREGNSAIATS